MSPKGGIKYLVAGSNCLLRLESEFPMKASNSSFVSWSDTPLMFFFLFDMDFTRNLGLPTWVTGRRTVLFLLLILVLIQKRGRLCMRVNRFSERMVRSLALALSCFFLYTLAILLYAGWGSGEHLQIHIIKMLLITVLGAQIISEYFGESQRLFKALCRASAVQGMVILLFLAFPTVQVTTDSLLNNVEHYLRLRSGGYATGIACAAAPGALRMAPGLISGIVLLLTERRSTAKWMLYTVLTACGMALIARTGLILAALGILVIILERKPNLRVTSGIVGSILALAFIALLLVRILNLTDTLTYYLQRAQRLLEKGLQDDFFGNYTGRTDSSTVIPRISIETVIGTGIISGISGNGIRINVDGGFIRLLTGFGIPVGICFYLFLLRFFSRAAMHFKSHHSRLVMVMMSVYIFLGEVKEYFVFDLYALCLFCAMLLLLDKSHWEERNDGNAIQLCVL